MYWLLITNQYVVQDRWTAPLNIQVSISYDLHLVDADHLDGSTAKQEDDATQTQSIDDWSKLVPSLVSAQVLSQQVDHAFLLPKEEQFNEESLEQALKIGYEKSES